MYTCINNNKSLLWLIQKLHVPVSVDTGRFPLWSLELQTLLTLFNLVYMAESVCRYVSLVHTRFTSGLIVKVELQRRCFLGVESGTFNSNS